MTARLGLVWGSVQAGAVALQPAVGPRFDTVQTRPLRVGGSFVNASRRPHR